MKRFILIIPIVLLTACATMPSAVSCDNADRVRAAAALALQTLDRVCPIEGVR